MYLTTLNLGWLVVGDCVTNTFADNPHEEKELEAWGEYLASPPLTPTQVVSGEGIRKRNWMLKKKKKSSVNEIKPTEKWHALFLSRDLSL